VRSFIVGEAGYERLARRRLKNFSKNRPERTNLNHQYAIRRVFIVSSSPLKRSRHISDSAKGGKRV